MSFTRSHRPAARSTHTLAMWFGILTICFSFLNPIVSLQLASAAQGLTTRQDPLECDAGFVLDPATGQCVAEEAPTRVQTDQPACDEGEERDPATGACMPASGGIDDLQAEPTNVPEIGEPPQQLPSAVHVTLYECPSQADPLAPWEQLTAECTSPSSTPLTMTHAQDGGAGTPQEVTGAASWIDLAPGGHSLSTTLPTGFAAFAAWCGPYIEGETLATLEMMPIAGGTTVRHELLNGESLYCDWFMIQAPATTGYVQVHDRICPDGFVLDETVTITDLQNQCVDPGIGTSFSVLTEDVELASATTDASGTAQLGEVPAGDIAVVQAAPAGYVFSAVYCFADYAFQPLEHTYTEEDRQTVADGATVTWTLEADDLLECYWYNAPGDGIGDLVAEGGQEPMEGGVLIVEKHRCPLGVVEDGELEDYQAICTQEHDGIEFTVSHEGGSFPDTTANGEASWAGIPEGEYQLQETIPVGYKDSLVFCAFSMIPDGGFGLVERMDATGGLVELLMPGSGYETTCQVFNIPDETANTLTVRKTVCPEGFDGDENDAPMQCTEPTDGVTFLLGDEEATTGDGGPGTAVFMDIPSGDYEHSEIVPDGTGQVIYDGCYLNGAPAITIVLQGDPPVSLISFGEGDHWECRWYNVPDVSFDVVIHKQVCAPTVEFVPANAIPDFATIDALCPEEMDGIPFTIDHAEGTDTSQTVDGTVTFADVPPGEFSLSEEVPSGFLQPLWYCSFAPAGGGALPAPEFVVTPGGALTDKLTDPAGGTYMCFVFNVPDDGRIVTVWKWACPAGLEAESEDFQDWADTCANHPPSIDFTVIDADGEVSKPLAGMAWWAPVAAGDVEITEHTPPGYQDPIVFCGLEAYSGDGAAFAEGMTMMPVDGSSVSRTLDHEFFSWECHFFNIPHDSGDITIRKFDCPTDLPAPYDPYAPGADPENDCALTANDYTFTLTPPAGPDVVQTTGDVVPSGVSFTSLVPGDYVVTEDAPLGIHSVFIWSCTGSNIPAVHPTPLSVGPVFAVTVAAGDHIVCNWFNVYPPDDGSVTVHKYLCSTPVFVSEVDCETYEFGVAFELIRSVDDASYGVKVTDAMGTATWWPVEPGVVQLMELDGEACHIEMSQDDGNGNPMVDMGEQTVIDVYNCSDDPSTPGGKIPEEYPNTGVPSGIDGPAPPMQDATPPGGMDDDAYFAVRCLEGAATPVPGTEACPRGAVPEHIAIDAIGVDHEVEILEVIDGVMQAPTGPDIASWYKETGRLGERNNTVIAGHLNYWGVPEAIFFSLHSLQEGDRVEIAGDDGRTYVYEVRWTRMESNLAPPAGDIVGVTDEPSLTLITCGGSWNAAISEYDQRTVVRAVLVDVVSAGQQLEID